MTEKAAYTDYYGLMIDLKTSSRRPDQLTGLEYNLVETLAGDNLEVSAFARALLEQSYGVHWEHEVEEPSVWPIAKVIPGLNILNDKESQLFDAEPNPTSTHTVIKTYITETDAENKAILVVRDVTGRQVASYPLRSGENNSRISTMELQPGLYMYSLVIKDKIKETKKLSVTH